MCIVNYYRALFGETDEDPANDLWLLKKRSMQSIKFKILALAVALQREEFETTLRRRVTATIDDDGPPEIPGDVSVVSKGGNLWELYGDTKKVREAGSDVGKPGGDNVLRPKHTRNTHIPVPLSKIERGMPRRT